jgi:hypothetical protein
VAQVVHGYKDRTTYSRENGVERTLVIKKEAEKI